ncbi:hypothetical protein CG50_15325 [Paenirhodobacter enshiensis]|uniref:Nucleoside triphosphate hydrolase n=2 Tax=Paenirhodobacter enshiensis TaxID=1105367 RepID=A0A086Y1V1_9RHOB|nr:hypothetical protein CG50_15325 [Paenirhodobacter enshiensis]
MPSELRVERADLAAHLRQLGEGRMLIAISGAPGAGKSTLAAEIAADLNARTPGSAAVVAMDGFHLPNDELDARGLLARKGAPETFDAAGLLALLSTLKTAREDIRVPLFDRAADAVLPDAGSVPASTQFVLVEGNYLLLNRPVWRGLFPLFDLTIRLSVPETVLRTRLAARWSDLPETEARARIEANDLPNGRILAREGRAADLVVVTR